MGDLDRDWAGVGWLARLTGWTGRARPFRDVLVCQSSQVPVCQVCLPLHESGTRG